VNVCTWQVVSPQKSSLPRHRSFGGLSNDGFATPVDSSVSNGISTLASTPTEALFAAVNCVTAYQDATCNCYTRELQGLLASIRFNGQHSNGPHWPPVLSCVELSSQLSKQQPCRVASVRGGKMVNDSAFSSFLCIFAILAIRQYIQQPPTDKLV